MEIILDKMTVPEKLRLMEALWSDLSKHSDDLDLPAWHGASVAGDRAAGGRRKRVRRGLGIRQEGIAWPVPMRIKILPSAF